jgi:hypothetical protein
VGGGGEAGGKIVQGQRTVEEMTQSQATPCEIYGGQCKAAIGFVLENKLSPASIIPPMLYAYSFTSHKFCMILAINRICMWHISNKAVLLQILVSTGQKSTFTFSLQRFNYYY